MPGPTSFAVMRRSSTQRARLRVGERLGQQVVQFEHLDAALAHLQHEVVVVLLRLVHPEHVVEQQIGAVARREPLVGEARPADEDRPQLADFTVDANVCMAPLLTVQSPTL